MLKKFYKLLCVFLINISILNLLLFYNGRMMFIDNIIYAKETNNNSSLDIRACWVSFLDIEEFLSDLDEDAYRYKIDEMYDNMLANNLNTVIFHVRPMCDAIYPSKLFPWSSYISSDRSSPLYDPLQIAIDEAHSKGLRFEAWINPYRVSRNNTTTVSYKQTGFYEQYKDIIIEYENFDGETCLALDPANEKSTSLICEGISEIIDNYDVDGIHFDDYFYVGGMFDELTSNEKQDNVNKMVSTVYTLIKESKNNCVFGISPAGNLDNARNDGADIDTWLSIEGYVDYIMPQLYWTDEFINSDGVCVNIFSERCESWQNINMLDKPIYAGLALYKAGEISSSDPGWNSCDDNLKKQCFKAYETGYDGYALFRYSWLEKEESINELDNLNLYVESFSPKQSDDISYEEVSEALSYDTSYDIFYTTYTGYPGDKSLPLEGVLSGINKRGIDGVRIALNNYDSDSMIEYRVHSYKDNWSPWSKNGELAGVTGRYSFIDGIQIRLNGNICEYYDLFYRARYMDGSWTKWYTEGDLGGYMGTNGVIDILEIKLEAK